MTLTITSTLSPRGNELAEAGGMRKKFGPILKDSYDPDTNPGGIVNIGVAENYLMNAEATAFINKHLKLQAKDFTYGEGPWGSNRLRTAMAKHMNRHFHTVVPIDKEELLFANGVTSLCTMLAFCIAEPGDGILMSSPIYQAFPLDFGLAAKAKCVYATFDGIDQFSPAAVQIYEDTLLHAQESGTAIRALLLCHPHNPLGQCYPKSTLLALMALCQKYKIHLLVDEIYALSVYSVPDPHAVEFESVLSFDSSHVIDPKYLHVLYGFSKDYAASGIRMGCIYTRNTEIMDAMGAITQFHWSGGANERVATLMLESEEWMDRFLELSRSRLASRNVLVRKILDDAGIDYHRGNNAGFFFWVDLRPFLPSIESQEPEDQWAREEMLMKRFLEQKVFVTNGRALQASEPGWFRIIFSQDERVIREGLKRIIDTVKVALPVRGGRE